MENTELSTNLNHKLAIKHFSIDMVMQTNKSLFHDNVYALRQNIVIYVIFVEYNRYADIIIYVKIMRLNARCWKIVEQCTEYIIQ